MRRTAGVLEFQKIHKNNYNDVGFYAKLQMVALFTKKYLHHDLRKYSYFNENHFPT